MAGYKESEQPQADGTTHPEVIAAHSEYIQQNPKKRGRGRPRKNRPVETASLDTIIAHNEYLERKAARNAKKPGEGYKFVWPRSHEGDILAHTWVGTIHNPCKWLANYAAEKGFTPHKNPWTMNPYEQQRAVTRVVCPQKLWATHGCGVNFEQDPNTLYTSCVVVLYSTNLLNFWTVKYQHFYGGHFYAAQGTVDDLHRKLATGEAGRNVILPAMYCGLPIGDNTEFRVKED